LTALLVEPTLDSEEAPDLAIGTSRGRVLAAAVTGSAVAGAAVAQAATPLQMTHDPTLSGTAQVGAPLAAVGAQWTGPPDTKVSWHWLRCADRRCRLIDGALRSSYKPVPADVGARLLAWLTLTADDQRADAFTRPSAAVTAAPAATPVPTPTATPAPAPAPARPAPPAAPVVPVAAPPAPQRPRMLRPFPVVRIRGVLTADGVRLTLVTVTAPHGARVTISCRGRGCPSPRLARTAGVVRLRRFEAPLAAGTRLRVTVSKRGYIAKVTTFRIRRGRVPLRTDGCRYPGRARVQRCPSR
jgi:hypothetical protein